MLEIPCKEVARKIIDSLKSKPTPKKTLAAVLVGGNSASISFLRQKEKSAKELSIDFHIYEFPENILQGELNRKMEELAEQESIGGLIIQLPLNEHIDSQEILNLIPQEKDIDVLSERAFKSFCESKNKVLPPAAGVVKEILETLNLELGTLKIAVIGTGQLIGKPISVWLEKKIAKLSILNSKTENVKEELKNADIIISGAGRANLFSAEDVKENTIIIDFGYSFVNGEISGDFDASSIENCKLKIENLKYTPTPGGTGPILVAKIMENFYKLNGK